MAQSYEIIMCLLYFISVPNVYNAQNTLGKIVVLKFWFIKCQGCVEEIPYVNEIFNKYKNRNDIVFISLALDKTNALKEFLKKHTFNYPVVANQEKYLDEDLQINSYPTHIIINKKGKVVSVVENAKAMAYVLSDWPKVFTRKRKLLH